MHALMDRGTQCDSREESTEIHTYTYIESQHFTYMNTPSKHAKSDGIHKNYRLLATQYKYLKLNTHMLLYICMHALYMTHYYNTHV